MRLVLVFIMFLFTVNTGWGKGNEFKSGNDFLRECNLGKAHSSLTDSEVGELLPCYVYLKGFVEAITVSQVISKHRNICLPSGPAFTPVQIWEIAIKGMQDQPEKLGGPAPGLIYLSLMKAFPCTPAVPPAKPAEAPGVKASGPKGKITCDRAYVYDKEMYSGERRIVEALATGSIISVQGESSTTIEYKILTPKGNKGYVEKDCLEIQ